MTPEAKALQTLADLADMIAYRDGCPDPHTYRQLAGFLRVAAISGQPLGSVLSTRDYVSMSEAATATSISTRSLRRHIAAGELPSIKTNGRRLIRTDDLRDWLNRKDAA